MTTKLFGSLFALSFLAAAIAGCAADASSDESSEPSEEEVAVEESEAAVTGAPSNFGYFIVTRRDVRRCASPLCGGFFVKRVNQATTVCADGSKQADCYVGTLQLSGIGLSQREEQELRAAVEDGKALIKARMYKKKAFGQTIGTLKANEGWLGATGSTPDGTFYRVAANGLVCVTTPCPSTSAYTLNASDSHNLINVHLDQTANPADQTSLDRAAVALGTTDGILIAGGVALPKCRPNTNCGPFASAMEFYLRVTRREGESCGGRGGNWYCNAGQYCNWKLGDWCGAADAAGKCAYKPEGCNKIYHPVCGCDGQTYGNECMAAAAGTSVANEGACTKQ